MKDKDLPLDNDLDSLEELTDQVSKIIKSLENEEDLNSIQKDISFSEEIQNEDINICERIQIGLESDGFDHGVFSKKYETGVSHFQSYIEEKINNG